MHCIAAINHNAARPIGTEGDDQSEVQTKGTGDDAEHGTEEQTKNTEKEGIIIIYRVSYRGVGNWDHAPPPIPGPPTNSTGTTRCQIT